MSSAPKARVLLTLLVFAIALIVACGGGDYDDTLTTGSGGTVAAGNVTHDVPAGALSEDTSISIEVVSDVTATPVATAVTAAAG